MTALTLFAGVKPPARADGGGANPVQRENARKGSGDWQRPSAPPGAIEGYASAASVAPAQKISFHVSTSPAEPYRVMVYRLGWYGGLGARRVACLPGCSTNRTGRPHPVGRPNAATGELKAGWRATDELSVPRDWVSGYYLAELVLRGGPAEGSAYRIPFIVRAPARARTRIIVQAAVNTVQAYNDWGGKSLYDYNSSGGRPATHVSFDRPLSGEAINIALQWDVPLLRFLERHGYDVSYTTDVDTDRRPRSLLRHHLVMTAGHDEYWTRRMRDAFQAARARGVNLAFLGANTAYWQMRYMNRRRSIVEYRWPRSADPDRSQPDKTVRFRDLRTPRPECELLGVQHEQGIWSKGAQIENEPSPDYTVVGAGDPWFRGTGFHDGDVLAGIVGYEYDSVHRGCRTSRLRRLFHWLGSGVPGRIDSAPADAVRYTTRSGATVFSSGTMQFSWALDGWGGHNPDPRGQAFMRNVLRSLTRRHAG